MTLERAESSELYDSLASHRDPEYRDELTWISLWDALGAHDYLWAKQNDQLENFEDEEIVSPQTASFFCALSEMLRSVWKKDKHDDAVRHMVAALTDMTSVSAIIDGQYNAEHAVQNLLEYAQEVRPQHKRETFQHFR